MDDIWPFVARVEEELLPHLTIESVRLYDPIVIRHVPSPWTALGMGNYAAAFALAEFPGLVAKVYAPGRPGLQEEAHVYNLLGQHPAFARCYHVGANYLTLSRLTGVTFYECLRRGIEIPEQAVRDIDEALEYARRRHLTPADVHAKNVMVADGRGKVVDISDFASDERDSMWDDLRNAYYRYYRPLLGRRPVPIPDWALNLMRRGYRWLRSHSRSS